MKFSFGVELARSGVAGVEKASPPLSGGNGFLRNLFGAVREPFTGAWQKNVQCDSKQNIMAFSAVFSCVTRIASDISKLCIDLVEETDDIWSEVSGNSPFAPVLTVPNSYQTAPQFLAYWITMKMMYGNAYIFKEFDGRGIVVAMHVLDSRTVTPLIAPDGSVFYELKRDDLAGVRDAPAIPQRYIMHDRVNTLWHPLVGVSPIFACGASATQGIRIQANSATFFENMSRPSGMLTAPMTIDQVTAKRLKDEFETKFGGSGNGRLFVGGDGLKYDPMTMPAVDAQLIEQLRWTVEDVARCFHVPLYKIGAGAMPTFTNMGALNLNYYDETLHPLINDAEQLLIDGLNLRNVTGKSLEVRFDLDGLLRMDQQGMALYLKDAVGAGVMSPNEARKKLNLGKTDGGDDPYLQQQNYSLADLAKRSTNPAPVAPAFPALPAPAATPALPPPAPSKEFDAVMARMDAFEKFVGDAVRKPEPEVDEEVEFAKQFAAALIAEFAEPESV